MRFASLILLLCLAGPVCSQQATPTPNVAQEDPADEIGKLKKNCPFKHIIGCGEVLFTGQPIHIAVGSIAPQNGVAAGLAFVGHKTTDNWRNSWDVDAVASGNASWRAGLYVKLVDSREPDISVQKGTKGADANPTELPEQPVINLYVQAISLNKLIYFGLGPSTPASGRSFYGMTETIVGASGVKTIYERLHIGIYGEINGRKVEIRPNHDEASPSIEQVYTEATAPGLTRNPFFLQPGLGMRIRPSFADDLFHLNYDLSYRPYIAISDSGLSFQRLTFDLSHEMSLYRTRTQLPRETNGPDDCIIDPTADRPSCPKATTRDLEGSIGLRFLTVLSMTPGGDTVPFYFQPTIGGSDINGYTFLGSYPDYRFRAPNLLSFRESFEHSIWKLPVGVVFFADQGNLALTRGDLASSHWKHSFSTGLTLRAGAFPQVYILFSWGGNEGTHTTANINTSLLGSSARPSLF